MLTGMSDSPDVSNPSIRELVSFVQNCGSLSQLDPKALRPSLAAQSKIWNGQWTSICRRAKLSDLVDRFMGDKGIDVPHVLKLTGTRIPDEGGSRYYTSYRDELAAILLGPNIQVEGAGFLKDGVIELATAFLHAAWKRQIAVARRTVQRLERTIENTQKAWEGEYTAAFASVVTCSYGQRRAEVM